MLPGIRACLLRFEPLTDAREDVIVYNLIMSGNDEAWEKSPSSMEVVRLGEYTPAALKEHIRS